MTESLLKQIQDTVVKYTKVISNVVNVDVEIIDKDFNRIAGTGVYEDKINENILKEAYVYSEVIKTGEHHIIENPGQHVLCKECQRRNCCVEKLEISTPIKFEDEIIGVIGLICSTEEQRSNILNKMVSYLQFLDQIAEFIGNKIYEYLETERNKASILLLEQIINNVDKGVIIIDDNDCIFHINNSAMKQLRLTPEYVGKGIKITSKNEFIIGEEEFSVFIEDSEYRLLGEILLVPMAISSHRKVFIFNQIRKLKNDAYEITNAHQSIKVDNILGQCKKILNLKKSILKAADSNSTILITGESGTGKELVARAIHSEGKRRGKPFIAINCGAIPDALLESEFFGYVKGAFSGANPNGRIGKFELANKGVIFLDEIGDMPLHLQVKILRVIQERKLVRIGSNQLIDLDIRVIAATNKDLKQLIKENKFREDLYYRLNVIPIDIPPLRERDGDIEIIIMKLIEKYNGVFDKYVHTIDIDAKAILVNYPWPGNIRELENTIEYMINLADESGILTIDMIPQSILEYKGGNKVGCNINDIRTLKDIENEYILKALDICGRDTKGKQVAAKKLGIGIATLYRKLEDL
ncbi:sigma-54 interaction domain-containing protein [Clostridium thailandense]|uniref:sigma-54 interaction domain-containing protein n=1 Tax=Clostridium thailandense TaxID=2794346 RepID=UPI00398917B1